MLGDERERRESGFEDEKGGCIGDGMSEGASKVGGTVDGGSPLV